MSTPPPQELMAMCGNTWTPRTCKSLYSTRSPIDHTCFELKAYPHRCFCHRCFFRDMLRRKKLTSRLARL